MPSLSAMVFPMALVYRTWFGEKMSKESKGSPLCSQPLYFFIPTRYYVSCSICESE